MTAPQVRRHPVMPGGQTRAAVVRAVGRGISAGVLLVVLLLPGTVLGHAGFLGSSPADGAHLSAPPAALTVDFSEVVGVRPDGVRLVDSAGAAIALPAARADRQRVVQDLPALGQGWYLATWSVVSEDGHIIHGAAAFAIGDVAGPPPVLTADPRADLGPPAARTLADAGQLLATGSLLGWVVFGARSRRVRRLGIGGSIAGLAGATLLAALIGGAGGPTALGGAAFLGAAVRAAGLLLAALAWWGQPRLAAIPLAATLVAMLAGGHPGGEPLTAALLLLHLAGAAAWLAAAPAVLVHLGDPATQPPSARAMIHRFSTAAPVALALAVGAGGILALDLTDGLTTVQPAYLAGLGLKVAAVGVAALLGAIGRRRLAAPESTARADPGRPPFPGRPAFLRLFAMDTVLFAAVLAGSGLLTVGAPTATVAAPATFHVGHCEAELDGRFLDVTLDPARVGLNTVTVVGGPAAGSLDIELRRPDDPGAIHAKVSPTAGDGARTWTTGPVALPVQGDWEVTVVARPDEFSQATAACRLGVGP